MAIVQFLQKLELNRDSLLLDFLKIGTTLNKLVPTIINHQKQIEKSYTWTEHILLNCISFNFLCHKIRIGRYEFNA